jgi:hypothetical protein
MHAEQIFHALERPNLARVDDALSEHRANAWKAFKGLRLRAAQIDRESK